MNARMILLALWLLFFGVHPAFGNTEEPQSGSFTTQLTPSGQTALVELYAIATERASVDLYGNAIITPTTEAVQKAGEWFTNLVAKCSLRSLVEKVGVDIYRGAIHHDSKNRDKLNEQNRGEALLIYPDMACMFPSWKGDWYTLELYLKLLGRILNSVKGSANHYGIGFTAFAFKEVFEKHRVLAGLGIEYLDLNYCNPKYNACVDELVPIPYWIVGYQYAADGVTIAIAPMRYLLPKGSAGDGRITLRTIRLVFNMKVFSFLGM